MSQPPYPTAPGAPYPRYVVHQLLHIVWLKSRVGLDLDFCLPRDQDLPVQHRQGNSVFSSLLCCLVSTVESVDDRHILILNSGIIPNCFQWRIQNFPGEKWISPLSSWAWSKNLLFGKIFAENCMKMREIGPEGVAPSAFRTCQWFSIPFKGIATLTHSFSKLPGGSRGGEGTVGGWGFFWTTNYLITSNYPSPPNEWEFGKKFGISDLTTSTSLPLLDWNFSWGTSPLRRFHCVPQSYRVSLAMLVEIWTHLFVGLGKESHLRLWWVHRRMQPTFVNHCTRLFQP